MARAFSVDLPPHRLDRLRAWMADQDLDACVVAGAQSITHLTGYYRCDGGPSALVVANDGPCVLVVMQDEVPAAQRLAQVDDVRPYGERGFGINLHPLPDLVAALSDRPVVQRGRRFGLADGIGGLHELLASHGSATWVDARDALARIRQVRDPDELIKALHAYELSWLAQAEVRRRVAPGITEIELYDAAQSAAQLAQGEPIEFFADLAVGANTSRVGAPAHVAGDTKIRAGDPIIADIALRAGGYGGDTAETFVAGRNDEVEALRAQLIAIREACAAELVPGTTGAEIFAAMRDRVIEAFPHGELPHHAGHAVGVVALESPHMVPADSTALESWMLISLEPGVYFPGRHGARVENTYLVTPGGGAELRSALYGYTAQHP